MDKALTEAESKGAPGAYQALVWSLLKSFSLLPGNSPVSDDLFRAAVSQDRFFLPPQGVAMPSVWKQWRWQPRCAPSPGSSGSLSHLMHCFSLRWAIFFKAKHCEEDGSQSSMVVGVSFETKCCRESRLPNKLFLCRFDSIEQLMKPPFCCFALDTSCLILNVTLSPSRSPLCCLY